jgi:hypothetical protein
MELIYYVRINEMNFASTKRSKLEELLKDLNSSVKICPRYFNEFLFLSKGKDVYIL